MNSFAPVASANVYVRLSSLPALVQCENEIQFPFSISLTISRFKTRKLTTTTKKKQI